MQTFLPFPDFQQSASVLDNKRLFKQVVEARQILNTLLSSKGWIHHPAVLQWKGSEVILFRYTLDMADECISRGINAHNEIAKLKLLTIDSTNNNVPKWFGNAAIHSTHRSRLICKGYADSVCAGIKKCLKIKSIDVYLKQTIGKTKNQLRYHDVMALESFYKTCSDVPLTENYYTKYGWSDNPAAEYIWGSKI